GSLLVATDYSLYRWRPDGSQQELTSQSAPISDVKQIVSVGENEIWALSPRRLYRLTDWKRAASPSVAATPFPNQQSFTRIARRRDRSIWASGDTLTRLEFNAAGELIEIENDTSREGLPANRIQLLVEDQQGNLWGATEGAGIFRITESGFTV